MMMNSDLNRVIWVIWLFSLLPSIGLTQAEINIKAGIETWSFKDERMLNDRSRHPGQSIGVDVLVEKGRGLFVPGFHYHRVSAINEAHAFEFNFQDPRHLHYFSIPLLFGYKLTDASLVDLSVLGGPAVQFFYDVDEDGAGLDDDRLHGVSTKLIAAVHTEWFSFLTAEVRYHYGLQPLIRNRDESKTRGISFVVGFTF